MKTAEAADRLRAAGDALRFLETVGGPVRRRVRERAGMSRAELADLIGVSVAKVTSFEHGDLPSWQDADAYRVVLESLMPAAEIPGEIVSAGLSDEDRAKVQQYFDNEQVCPNCRGVHTRACPRVRSVAYYDNGALKSVEYWADDQWPKDAVIFQDSPEMAIK